MRFLYIEVSETVGREDHRDGQADRILMAQDWPTAVKLELCPI